MLSFSSEPMWPIEARCASIANNYFTVAINRIGTVSTVCLNEISEISCENFAQFLRVRTGAEGSQPGRGMWHVSLCAKECV